MAADTYSLWYKVWQPFLILFLITVPKFIVAITVPKGTLFILVTIAKAFYITAYFMHMKFERVSLAYTIISPLVLLFALWYEGTKLFQLLFG